MGEENKGSVREILGLGFLLLALWGCATAGGRVEEPTYTNPVYRWSVSYPRGWSVDASQAGSVMFRGEGRRPGILGIHTIPATRSRSLDDAVAFVLQAYPPERYATVSRRNITLPNGFPAVEIVHHIGRGTVGQSRKVITIAKGRGFFIDAETYLDSWNAAAPHFDRIIDSFAVQD